MPTAAQIHTATAMNPSRRAWFAWRDAAARWSEIPPAGYGVTMGAKCSVHWFPAHHRHPSRPLGSEYQPGGGLASCSAASISPIMPFTVDRGSDKPLRDIVIVRGQSLRD